MDAEVASPAAIYRYQFAARGIQPPVQLCWYDGGMMPARPDELEDDDEMGQSGNGTLFVGDKGKIMTAGWGGAPRLLPLSRMETYQRPPKAIPRSKGHHRDWLDACKGGPAPSSNFENGARLTEIVLLGNVALRSGKKIRWDYENMKVKNSPEAEKYLKDGYRQGWEIPA